MYLYIFISSLEFMRKTYHQLPQVSQGKVLDNELNI